MRDETEWYTKPEVIAALRTLSPTDLMRLRRAVHFRYGGPGLDPDDLLQEAFLRCIRGVRHWPRGFALVPFVLSTVRSIANSKRRAHERREWEKQLYDDNEKSKKDAHWEERAAIMRRAYGEIHPRLERLFADDSPAWTVLQGDMEGCPAPEIRRRLGLGEKEYGTVRRRLRRKITQEFHKDDYL